MFYNKIRCIGKVGKTEKLANNLQIKNHDFVTS